MRRVRSASSAFAAIAGASSRALITGSARLASFIAALHGQIVETIAVSSRSLSIEGGIADDVEASDDAL